uniref:Uncharacterized protein n=1 Tax=Knipowitschia caucasica TaxID=637954 RepID=A0AAV2L5L3_KNICA
MCFMTATDPAAQVSSSISSSGQQLHQQLSSGQQLRSAAQVRSAAQIPAHLYISTVLRHHKPVFVVPLAPPGGLLMFIVLVRGSH